MKNFTIILTPIPTLICNLFSFLFGGWDKLLTALLVFVIVDFIAFLIDAIIFRTLSLQTALTVLIRKILIFALVVIANVLDQTIIQPISFLRSPVIIFFIYSEAKSFLKYAKKFGVPIPNKLSDALNKPVDQSEEEKTNAES